MTDLLLLPAVAAGVIAVVWASRRPLHTIVPVYAFLVPIGGVFALRVPLPSPFNTLSSVAGALAIGGMALHLLRSRRGRIPTVPVGAWLVFVAWAGLTFLWAQDPGLVMRELTLAFPLVLLLVLAAMLPASVTDLARLRDAVVASGIAVGGYALLLTISGAALPAQRFSSRFSLTAGDTEPNQLAASLLLPLVLSVDLSLDPRSAEQPGWRRSFGWAGVGLSAFAIALSGSRGGALAAVAGVAVTLVVAARWRPWERARVRKVVRGTFVGALLVTLVAALVIVLFPENRFSTSLAQTPVQRLVETESSSGRAEIWTTGALACARYCGTGAGLGNFARAYRESVAFSNVTRNVGLERPGHNLYLEIGVEAGIVGIVLFALAIAAEWRTLRRRRATIAAVGLAGAIAALLVADVFEGFLWFKHTWLPFMMIRVFEGAADAQAAVPPHVVHASEADA